MHMYSYCSTTAFRPLQVCLHYRTCHVRLRPSSRHKVCVTSLPFKPHKLEFSQDLMDRSASRHVAAGWCGPSTPGSWTTLPWSSTPQSGAWQSRCSFGPTGSLREARAQMRGAPSLTTTRLRQLWHWQGVLLVVHHISACGPFQSSKRELILTYVHQISMQAV